MHPATRLARNCPVLAAERAGALAVRQAFSEALVESATLHGLVVRVALNALALVAALEALGVLPVNIADGGANLPASASSMRQ